MSDTPLLLGASAPVSTFSDKEWLRYTRHLQLPQIGVTGQQHLKQSTVLIVGAGGLGSPVALYLAAAGVGHIIMVDGDTVDLTNLQRQILFTTEQVGLSKAECAKQRLSALNNSIEVTAVAEHLSVNNVDALFEGVDLVLDCTDNFATRYLINDTCVTKKIPWVFASIFQFSGQCALFTPEAACFRCLFPDPPVGAADCNAAGVLGVLPGLLGTLQANEAIKFLTELECPLENNLLLVEALDLTFRKIQLAKNPGCSVCGDFPVPADTSQYQVQCEVDSHSSSEILVSEFMSLKQDSMLTVSNSITSNSIVSSPIISNYVLLDVRTDTERAAFHLGGEHVPLDNLNARLAGLDAFKGKEIICYCQTGIRSSKAANILNQLGWKACSLKGGIVSYLKSTQFG